MPAALDTGWLVDTTIYIPQGGTYKDRPWQLCVKPTEATPDEDATPDDSISGATAKMVIKESETSPEALLTLTTENGGLAAIGDDALVDPFITDEQSAALPPGKKHYEVELYQDGEVLKFAKGVAIVGRELITT